MNAVAALVDAGPVLTAEAPREILAQLNDLLASYRKLDVPVRQYLAAGGNTPSDELEQELVGLTRRRDAKSDALACATMDPSIALCSQRLSSARALGPAREQAEAQLELILQAMASVPASLSRMVATGAKIADADVNTLQLTVSQV
ncbi:MAG: hypothetical protein ACO1SX_25150 [Actinomycetota bacterium]